MLEGMLSTLDPRVHCLGVNAVHGYSDVECLSLILPARSATAGSLRGHLKLMPPDTREALIRALLEDAPQDLMCDLIDCEFHDHNASKKCVGRLVRACSCLSLRDCDCILTC